MSEMLCQNEKSERADNKLDKSSFETDCGRVRGWVLSHVVTPFPGARGAAAARLRRPPRFAWRAPRRAAASRQQGLTTLGKVGARGVQHNY